MERVMGWTARRRQLTHLAHWHLASHPEAWFSAHELARVIREKYLHEPPVPLSRYGYGRSNVLHAVLSDLQEEGLAESRTGSRRDTLVWRAGRP